MTTPTSGPWAISGIHHSIGIAPDDGKSDGIATVFGCGPKAEANARLISAAPDLLSALQRAEAALSWFINDDGESDIEALDEARAAISKAKGEA